MVNVSKESVDHILGLFCVVTMDVLYTGIVICMKDGEENARGHIGVI